MPYIPDHCTGRALRLLAIAATFLVLGGCSPRPIRVPSAPSPIPESEALTRVGLVAHRCGAGEAPENTLAAARHCLEQDVAWIEVDVRTTRDGVLVALHDERLDRTTDCEGPVRHWTAAELASCDAGRFFSEEYAGESLPTLETMLRWAKGRIGVYLDVKDADPDAVVALVRRVGMADQCFFGFEGWKRSARFAAAYPDLALKQSVTTLAEIARAHDELGAKIVEIEAKHLTPQMVRACRERGLLWMAPLFGRQDKAYGAVLAWGPDLINLDHPARFRQVTQAP